MEIGPVTSGTPMARPPTTGPNALARSTRARISAGAVASSEEQDHLLQDLTRTPGVRRVCRLWAGSEGGWLGLDAGL